jgi:hypothetical protein
MATLELERLEFCLGKVKNGIPSPISFAEKHWQIAFQSNAYELLFQIDALPGHIINQIPNLHSLELGWKELRCAGNPAIARVSRIQYQITQQRLKERYPAPGLCPEFLHGLHDNRKTEPSA